MIIDYKGRVIQVKFWKGERLKPFWALDTETEMIGEDQQTPEMIIAQVYDGGDTVYLMGRNEIGDFLELHAGDTMVCHNFPFDGAVLSKLLGIDWHKAIEAERIWDTGIIYRLLYLATRGSVPRWNLSYLAQMLLDENVTKDDDDRLCWTMEMADKLEQVSEKRLRYAAYDAIITYECFQAMFPALKSYKNYLSHNIQLKGSIALDYTTKNGMCIDLSRRNIAVKTIEDEMERLSKILETYNWVKGKKGNTEVLQSFLREVEATLEVKLPRTATAGKISKTGKVNKDKISTSAEDLKKFTDDNPFLKAYTDFKTQEKLLSFVGKLTTNKVYPRYTTILETGRVSCNTPNFQQLPRKKGVREIVIPSLGNVFIFTDFCALELCTVSQICYSKFNYSNMRDLINTGKDLHRVVASLIFNKKEEDVTKDNRQLAKICSFGFLGGMCADSFVDYCRVGYNVIITKEESAKLKKAWLDVFPEMQEFLKDSLLDRFDWTDGPFKSENVALGVFKRIIRGETCNSQGEEYEKNVISWALNHVLPYLAPNFVGQEPSEALARKVISYKNVLPSGRVRSGCTFCAEKNSYFQGLGSDCAKIATYNVMRAGYRIVVFAHDEIGVEVPVGSDYKKIGEHISKIMIDSANSISPDVRYSCEYIVMDRWSKSAKHTEADGKIIPYSE